MVIPTIPYNQFVIQSCTTPHDLEINIISSPKRLFNSITIPIYNINYFNSTIYFKLNCNITISTTPKRITSHHYQPPHQSHSDYIVSTSLCNHIIHLVRSLLRSHHFNITQKVTSRNQTHPSRYRIPIHSQGSNRTKFPITIKSPTISITNYPLYPRR